MYDEESQVRNLVGGKGHKIDPFKERKVLVVEKVTSVKLIFLEE